MQQGSQRFTFGLIELRLHRFWSRRLLLETIQPFLLKGVKRIAHGLGRTAQVAGDFFRTLPSAGSEQYLASTQGKGI